MNGRSRIASKPVKEIAPMALDRNALSSLSASLADLTIRIGDVAREAGQDEDALIDVLEVERQLQTAGRRLEKVLRRLNK